MPRPDGSINSDDWIWNDPAPSTGLPTLQQGWSGSTQSLWGNRINQTGANLYKNAINYFNNAPPIGSSGVNDSGFGFGGTTPQGTAPFTSSPVPSNYAEPNLAPFRSAPQPNITLPNVRLMPDSFGPQIAASYGIPNTGNLPFTLPGSTSYQGDPDRYYGGAVKFGGAGPTGATGAGGGGGAPNPYGGMSAGEKVWFDRAAKAATILGQDPAQFWGTTKIVYMNADRNGSPNPSVALGRQVDDAVWGKAAYAAGILTGNADHDAIVWRDHYNANGNMNADPMVGHNDAIAAYQAGQQQVASALNPQADAYPDWYSNP